MKYSVGGTEITEDADVVEVTATATLTCVFDRLQDDDGTPFTDEEMKGVGKDYIESEHFRMSDMNNVVYSTGEPPQLNKDVAAKLIKAYLLDMWTADLANAKKAEAGGSVIVFQQEIDDIEPLETYDEVKQGLLEFVNNWEPRPSELVEQLLEVLVEN